MTPSSYLARLPQELFQVIGLAIPLPLLSPTLLSLCMVCKDINAKTRDLLYFCIVLRNHDASSSVFAKIHGSPGLGRLVREIYILSEQSPNARGREHMTRVQLLGGLKDIVRDLLLPNLVTIGLFNRSRWSTDPGHELFLGDSSLDIHFWANLCVMAPQLRSVTIRRLGDDFDSPWVDDDVVDKMSMEKNLVSFNMMLGIPSIEINHIAANLCLFKNVETMRHSLHTLTLSPVRMYGDIDNAGLVDLIFPHLRSLELHGFHSASTERTTLFWRRHVKLERITLWGSSGKWFEQQDAPGLFPDLSHLKAPFSDIRALVPLLTQLRSLCVFDTFNMQVPYLFQSLLKVPLNGLLSLEIEQNTASLDEFDDLAEDEGAQWYQSSSMETIKKEGEDFKRPAMDPDYIFWIAKSCPNLQELGFLGHSFHEKELIKRLGSPLGQLSCLRHLYYPLKYGPDLPKLLVKVTRALAQRCPLLESNGHLRMGAPPLIAWVVRDSLGAIQDVAIRDRWGMEISVRPDDPFPDTVPWISSF